MTAPRILVVGAGSIGRRHHANLAELGARAELASWRATPHHDIAEALKDADAAVIATATDVRLPLVLACAARGIPVYVEKPLAFRPEDVAEIVEATAGIADRSMLGLMMRYHPAVRALAEADLADVFHARFSIGHDVTQWRPDWRFADSYAARADGGGVLLDLCHEIDMAACLFPGLVPGAVDSLGHAGFPGVDMASRVALHGPGLTVDVAMDYLTPALHRRAILMGTRHMHDFDFAAGRYVTDGTAREFPLVRNAMFLDAMRDFLALVAGRPVSGNPLMPRLDLCGASAALTARAWSARRFTGEIDKDMG